MLEPEIRAFIDRCDALYPSGAARLPFAEQRRVYDRFCAAFARPRPAGLVVRDGMVQGPAGPVRVRLYRRGDRARGTLVYFHGGGWVVGSLDSHDLVTAELARATGAAVVAVDYRLAPEHPAPAPLDDCLAVVRAALAGALPFDPGAGPGGKLVLAGDSAGGTLAAATALWLRDHDVAGRDAVAGMLLLYPALAFEPEPPAAATEADAPMLTLADMYTYRAHYLGDKAADAYDFPLLARRFDGLPRTLAIAVEHDPLRDDARVFVERMRAAGGDAEFVAEPGLVHGCLRALGTSPGVDRLYQRAAAFVAGCLG